MKKKNITICLNEETIEKLREFAAENKRSMSSMIEDMIDQRSLLGKPSGTWSRKEIRTESEYRNLRIVNLYALVPEKFTDLNLINFGDISCSFAIKDFWVLYADNMQEEFEKYLKTLTPQEKFLGIFLTPPPQSLKDCIKIFADNPEEHSNAIKVDGVWVSHDIPVPR